MSCYFHFCNYLGEPVLPGSQQDLEGEEKVDQEDSLSSKREIRNLKVKESPCYVKTCLQSDRNTAFAGKREVYDILVYLDSKPEMLSSSSETRRSLFRLVRESTQLGCSTPRLVLSRYQLLGICRDLEYGRVEYEVLYVLQGGMPQLEHRFSPDILCAIIEKYRSGDIYLLGEVVGRCLYVRGDWAELQMLKTEKYYENLVKARELVGFQVGHYPKKRNASLSSEVSYSAAF